MGERGNRVMDKSKGKKLRFSTINCYKLQIWGLSLVLLNFLLTTAFLPKPIAVSLSSFSASLSAGILHLINNVEW